MSSENNPPESPRPSEPAAGGQEWPRMPDSSPDRSVPPPTQGFGAPAYPQPHEGQAQPQGGQPPNYPPPAYGQQPQQYAYSSYGQQRDPDKRPTGVTVAAWLTWVFAGLTGLLYGVIVLMLLVAKDPLLEALQREPGIQDLDISTDNIIAALWAVSAVLIFWCLCAVVLAVFAYRRANWARIALVVSSVFSAILALLAITTIVSALHLIAAVAVVVLLFTGGANEWYARKNAGYPPYPPGPQGPGQPYAGQPYAGQYGGQGYGNQYPAPPSQPPQQGEQDPPKNVW
ncbi:MAG: hypothetical protein ACRDXB_18745 [Actinomycetes bacterium]